MKSNTEKAKKKSEKKIFKPVKKNTTEKANSILKIKRALKRINKKRIIIDAQVK